MTAMRKIAKASISTCSFDPLRGIFEIYTANSTMKFELDEDLAHSLCADLERFLTQPPLRKQGTVGCG